MADYSDGFANLAAAIGNYMAARKRRQADREDREDRKLERMERRKDIDDDRAFKREMATADLDFRRDYLDRVAPKKTLLDRVFEGAKSIFQPPNAQDNLTNAQAGLYNSQAAYNNRMAEIMGKNPGVIPTTVPIGMGQRGSPKMPKTPKPPKAKKAPEPDRGMVDMTRVMNSITDQLGAGIHRYFRENNKVMSPELVENMNLSMIIQKNLPKIEQRYNRRLTPQEIAAMEESLKYSLLNKVPASGGAR